MVLKGLRLGAKQTLPKSLRRYLQMDKQIRNMYYIQSLYLVEITRRILDEVCTLTGEHVPLSIGFIGCGRIGRGLAHKMLEAGVDPSAITVCTRRAEPLQRLIEQGVQHCVPESCAALASCRIIFLCCLPHQVSFFYGPLTFCANPVHNLTRSPPYMYRFPAPAPAGGDFEPRPQAYYG